VYLKNRSGVSTTQKGIITASLCRNENEKTRNKKEYKNKLSKKIGDLEIYSYISRRLLII